MLWFSREFGCWIEEWKCTSRFPPGTAISFGTVELGLTLLLARYTLWFHPRFATVRNANTSMGYLAEQSTRHWRRNGKGVGWNSSHVPTNATPPYSSRSPSTHVQSNRSTLLLPLRDFLFTKSTFIGDHCFNDTHFFRLERNFCNRSKYKWDHRFNRNKNMSL